MNRPPEILINSGYVTDQNGVLTELDMPNVVTTLTAPSKVAFLGTTLNFIPSTAAALKELYAPNIPTLVDNTYIRTFSNLEIVTIGATAAGSSGANQGLYNCTRIITANFPNLLSITDNNGNAQGFMMSCSSLVNLTAPKLETIACKGWRNQTFGGCTSLETLNLPGLLTIDTNTADAQNGAFYGCISLKTVTFESLRVIGASASGGGTFYGCTALENVTFGSDGNPVTSIGGNTFNGCTQSGLTITIYTSGGAALSGEPWGATNAVIEYEEA